MKCWYCPVIWKHSNTAYISYTLTWVVNHWKDCLLEKKERFLGCIIYIAAPQALCYVIMLWFVIILGGEKQMGGRIAFNSGFPKCASMAEAAEAE